jgi:hypothetical protein
MSPLGENIARSIKTSTNSVVTSQTHGDCDRFDHFGLQDQEQLLDTPVERQRARFYQVLSFRIHIYWKLMDTKIPTIWITKVNEPFLFSNHCLLMMLLPQFCIPLNEVFF